MSVFDVRHQPRAHRLVQRALAGDRVPHAHIFHGPDGVGKGSFAIGLAHLLICPHPREADVASLPEFEGWTGEEKEVGT